MIKTNQPPQNPGRFMVRQIYLRTESIIDILLTISHTIRFKMKNKVLSSSLLLIGLLSTTACVQTFKTTPVTQDVRLVEVVGSSGKVVRKYYEKKDTSGWFEAEQVNGRWKFTPMGEMDKNAALTGGGGGGGGGC